jgi:hypothetical protein
MKSAKAQYAGACYVFFRLFPGLREPCDLIRYVTLPDAEVSDAMEADANQWLAENKKLVIEKLKKQSSRITGPYLHPRKPPTALSGLVFSEIARIAGWTYPYCYNGMGVGVGGRYWATDRFPILAVANQQDAIAVCDGLNHRFFQNTHPDSPRFGWLSANEFPPHERLDIEVRIQEAQSQLLPIHPLAVQNPAMAFPPMIDGEAVPAIHALATQAVEFCSTLHQKRTADSNTSVWKPTKAVRHVIDLFKQGLSVDDIAARADVKVSKKSSNLWQIRHRAEKAGLLPKRKAGNPDSA